MTKDNQWDGFLEWYRQALCDEAIIKGLPPDTYTKQTDKIIKDTLESLKKKP